MAKPGSNTRQRLILAALELFAREGIDAVSMRTINSAAGARNASAVHYHFGNKLGIIEAVIDFIKERVDNYRISSVESLERRARSDVHPSATEIVWAAFAPYYQVYKEEEYGQAALRFLARTQTDMNEEIQAFLNHDPHAIAPRIDRLLAAALPELPDRTRRVRYLWAWSAMVLAFSSTADLERTIYGDIRPPADEGLHRFFDYVVGGITAPVSSDWPPSALVRAQM